MPASRPKRRAPKASRKKRLSHAFYLLQPFFQFFALMLVMLAVVGCSPLAPSTDKVHFSGIGGAGGSGSGSGSGSGGEAGDAIQEQAIQASLKEVSTHDAVMISASSFRKSTEGVKSSDDALDESASRALFAPHTVMHNVTGEQKRFFISLSPEQFEALLKNNQLRIDLDARLASTQAASKKILFRGMQKAQAQNALDATGFLVMPDAAMIKANGGYKDISLPLKISFGAPSDAKAYIEITRTGDTSQSDNNAALLDSASREADQLAIVLE